MTRLIKWLSLMLLLNVLFGKEAQANIITAASCGQTNVQNALNKAQNGDTVVIPAGTCTWTTAISTSGKGYILQGAGTGLTVIIHNLTSGASLNISVPSGSSLRVTGMTVQPASGTINYKGFLSISGGSTSVRMDHMAFTGWTFNNVTNGRPINFDDSFGVIDHCTFSGAFAQFIGMKNDAYLGVGSFGDNSWAQPTGFGSANALYLEDNTFTNTTPASGAQIVTDCDAAGCRYVIRHNTFISYGIGHHGTESAGRSRGGRQWEVYGNTFSCDASGNQSCNTTAMIRSGTGLYFNNTINSINGSIVPNWNGAVSLQTFRTADSLGGWGACDGRGVYDQNDGVTYASGSSTSGGTNNVLTDSTKNYTVNQWVSNGAPYSLINVTEGWGAEIVSNTATTITTLAGAGFGGVNDTHPWTTGDTWQILRATLCIDQPGRGQGDLLSGAGGPNGLPTQTGWPHDALEPVYIWNNTIGANVNSIGGSNTARTIANRDFYDQNASFNGTSGTGAGLLSARPATCTPVVAYWATDVGTPGTLYKCLTTNTWTAFYTPYIYPHPLALNSGTPPPASPSNLAAIVH